MTVDMLAAAFIWPEEVLVGRTHIGDDIDTPASAAAPAATDAAEELEAAPFWAVLMRRFRADPPSEGAGLR